MMECGKMRHRMETDKRKIREELVPSTSAASSSSDIKFEMILKEMEKLIVYNRSLNREQNEPQIRNLNF